MSNLKLKVIDLNNNPNIPIKLEIRYAFIDSKYGKCLIGLLAGSVCYLSFYDNPDEAMSKFKRLFPKKYFIKDQHTCTLVAESIFEDTCQDLNVSLTGTAFQMEVWKELTNIKPGTTKSYEDIAKAIGRPKSIRAVANAIAHNNIAYVIPCHRVIRKNGKMAHKSRWGLDRKQQMLKHESVVL